MRPDTVYAAQPSSSFRRAPFLSRHAVVVIRSALSTGQAQACAFICSENTEHHASTSQPPTEPTNVHTWHTACTHQPSSSPTVIILQRNPPTGRARPTPAHPPRPRSQHTHRPSRRGTPAAAGRADGRLEGRQPPEQQDEPVCPGRRGARARAYCVAGAGLLLVAAASKMIEIPSTACKHVSRSTTVCLVHGPLHILFPAPPLLPSSVLCLSHAHTCTRIQTRILYPLSHTRTNTHRPSRAPTPSPAASTTTAPPQSYTPENSTPQPATPPARATASRAAGAAGRLAGRGACPSAPLGPT
jgi:hypothetical protein